MVILKKLSFSKMKLLVGENPSHTEKLASGEGTEPGSSFAEESKAD